MSFKLTTPVLLFITAFTISGCTNSLTDTVSAPTIAPLSELYSNQPSPTSLPSSTTIIPQGPPSQSVVSTTTQTDPVLTINTDKGPITVNLFSKSTPNTVANFIQKSAAGFYKGLTFHRVDPGFVIQGGDPLGTGRGGGIITSEINDIPFKKGSLGLARGPIKEESNDSQFFICLTDEACAHLTGQYVNFGQVLTGMDVATNIVVGDKMLDIIQKQQ